MTDRGYTGVINQAHYGYLQIKKFAEGLTTGNRICRRHWYGNVRVVVPKRRGKRHRKQSLVPFLWNVDEFGTQMTQIKNADLCVKILHIETLHCRDVACNVSTKQNNKTTNSAYRTNVHMLHTLSPSPFPSPSGEGARRAGEVWEGLGERSENGTNSRRSQLGLTSKQQKQI